MLKFEREFGLVRLVGYESFFILVAFLVGLALLSSVLLSTAGV
jgi:hypothetical protein